MLPGVSRLVAHEREAATKRLWDTLSAALSEQLVRELDALLVVPPGRLISPLGEWRTGGGPGLVSSDSRSRGCHRQVHHTVEVAVELLIPVVHDQEAMALGPLLESSQHQVAAVLVEVGERFVGEVDVGVLAQQSGDACPRICSDGNCGSNRHG